jgi:ABC-type transporter Mla subunit MlaD
MAKKKLPYAEILVGTFVLIGLTVLFIMIIFVAGKQNLLEGRLQVKAVFGRVIGLRPDSPVRLGGIEVGNVESMDFNDQGKVVVTMSIQQKYHPQIREDSSARIGSIGLLGDKTVEISVGSPNKDVVTPGGFLPSEDPYEITEVLEQAGPVIEDAKRITANILGVTEKLKSQGGLLGDAMDHASDILQKINSGQGTLGALINDKLLYQQLTDFLGEGKKLINNLQTAAQRIEGITEQLSKLTPSLQPTVRNFQESSTRIKESTVALKDSLDRLPDLLKKGDNILDNVGVVTENLRKASTGFPDIVNSSREALDEANTILKAAQKNFLLRRYIDKEETAKVITMDKRDQPYNIGGSENGAGVISEKAKKK